MSFADSMQDLENTNIYAEAVPARVRPSLMERVVQLVARMLKPRRDIARTAS